MIFDCATTRIVLPLVKKVWRFYSAFLCVVDFDRN